TSPFWPANCTLWCAICWPERAGVRPHRRAAAVPLHPGRHHLRRVQPDPTQHHRGAGVGPAARVTTVPDYPTGHQLLAGKSVLVTAAAGTGIGFATAKRCAEEGATVVVSDKHERRLAEAAEQLAEIASSTPVAIPSDVTDEASVQALFDGAIAATGGLDVVVNNAGLGGTVDLVEMTDDQWHVV